jgi:hypothetical protein
MRTLDRPADMGSRTTERQVLYVSNSIGLGRETEKP